MADNVHVVGNISNCARCQKKVFFNEQRRIDGLAFHPVCFTCANPPCGRHLDSKVATTHQDDAYCIYCYPKLFGPNGFGFGVPPALITEREWQTSSSTAKWITPGISKAFIAPKFGPAEKHSKITSSTRKHPVLQECTTHPVKEKFSAPDSQEECPVHCSYCGRCKKEVFAEKLVGAGREWHKWCFSCRKCSKLLDSCSVYERGGDLYCGVCCEKYVHP